MNIGKLGAAIALAAGLGLATTAIAQDNDSPPSGAADESGITTLGIDISSAGRSPEAISGFIAGLAPETQRGLMGGCQTAVEYPAGHHQSVIGFCNTALQVVGAGPALGFAPEEPAFAPQVPAFEPEMLPPVDDGAF